MSARKDSIPEIVCKVCDVKQMEVEDMQACLKTNGHRLSSITKHSLNYDFFKDYVFLVEILA